MERTVLVVLVVLLVLLVQLVLLVLLVLLAGHAVKKTIFVSTKAFSLFRNLQKAACMQAMQV